MRNCTVVPTSGSEKKAIVSMGRKSSKEGEKELMGSFHKHNGRLSIVKFWEEDLSQVRSKSYSNEGNSMCALMRTTVLWAS